MRCLRLAGRLRKARKPRGLTFIERHSRSTGKPPRCSSKNLNLTAFGSRRTGGLFWMFLSSFRLRTSRRSRTFSRARSRSLAETTSVPRCTLNHLFEVDKPPPRSSARWRRESPRVSAMRAASLRNSSVPPVPLVHLLCCTICDQRRGTKPRQAQYPGRPSKVSGAELATPQTQQSDAVISNPRRQQSSAQQLPRRQDIGGRRALVAHRQPAHPSARRSAMAPQGFTVCAERRAGAPGSLRCSSGLACRNGRRATSPHASTLTAPRALEPAWE